MALTPLSPSAQRARHLALSTGKALHESGHQKALFQWVNLMWKRIPELRWLHSVPNGAHVTKAQAGKLLAEGLRAGVPDLFLDVARRGYHGLRIELKVPEIRNAKGTITKRKGELSTEQEEWIQHYTEAGYLAIVAYGWEAARDAIEVYLDR